jgi:hypothetical protein
MFLVLVVLGCWVLPLSAAMASDMDTRATIASIFRLFFVLTVLITQLLGLRRILSENDGFFPDPAKPDGGPDPRVATKADGVSDTAFADASLNGSTSMAVSGDSARMSMEALLAFKIPSARYTQLHGWWQEGEDGSKRNEEIKLVKVKQTAHVVAHATGSSSGKEIHLDNPHHVVQPRHTKVPVVARPWPAGPLRENGKFVVFQLLEVLQLASMPVKAPDPGAREHDWLPAWFGDVAEFLRAFMIELPQMDKLVFECFFGAVAVCCLWAIVCGYMMLGLVSRQRPGLQKRLPAFAPDFLFQISWLVEFFMLGPCSMIVTKWLMRAADCTYLPDEKVLYFDMSPSTRCYEGAHTVRASLGATLLIFYTLTTANFAPSFIESWSHSKDIRVRPSFVAMASFVKLISVCVAVLATRVTWVVVLFPVLGSLWLLYISVYVTPPTNIHWASQLARLGYIALLWHSICISLAWAVQGITKEITPCSQTEGGGVVTESSLECVEEDEHPLAETFRLLPTVLHQVGLLLLLCCCAGAAFCRRRHHKVDVIQVETSQMELLRQEGIHADGGHATLVPTPRPPTQKGATTGQGSADNADGLALALEISTDAGGSAVLDEIIRTGSENAARSENDEYDEQDWLSDAEQAVLANSPVK